MGGNAEALAGEAEVLLRRGLDADGVHGQTEGVGNVPAHGRDMRGQLRALAEDRSVDVADLIAVLGDDAGDLAGQGQRVRALVGGVVIREVLADVAQRRRAQHSVHYGVQQHIRVGVAEQALLIRDLHAAHNELAILH